MRAHDPATPVDSGDLIACHQQRHAVAQVARNFVVDHPLAEFLGVPSRVPAAQSDPLRADRAASAPPPPGRSARPPESSGGRRASPQFATRPSARHAGNGERDRCASGQQRQIAGAGCRLALDVDVACNRPAAAARAGTERPPRPARSARGQRPRGGGSSRHRRHRVQPAPSIMKRRCSAGCSAAKTARGSDTRSAVRADLRLDCRVQRCLDEIILDRRDLGKLEQPPLDLRRQVAQVRDQVVAQAVAGVASDRRCWRRGAGARSCSRQ